MDLPIQDADRDRVIAALQRGHVAGYLDQVTLNRRVEAALTTTDAVELNDLLADLPDLSGLSWSPAPHQQLAPYTPLPPWAPQQPGAEPVWRQYLRDSWPWLAGGLAVFVAMMVMSAMNGPSFWWFFWIFFIFIRPAIRRARRQQRPAQPGEAYRPNAQPPPAPGFSPPPRDSYNPDDGSGGQWNQPPGR